MIIIIKNIKNLEFIEKKEIIKLKKILEQYYDIPKLIKNINKNNILYLYEYYMKLKRRSLKNKKIAKKQTRIFLYSFFAIKNYINLEIFTLSNFKIIGLSGTIIIRIITYKFLIRKFFNKKFDINLLCFYIQ